MLAEDDLELELSDGDRVRSHAIVLAMGVTYRRLEASGIEEFIGRGVFYTPAVAEAPWLKGCPVVIVGGGNSAGQAAVHLSRYASIVTLVVRGPSLAASMSDYLVRELRGADNVMVRFESEIVSVAGDDRLERVTVRIARSWSRRDGRKGDLRADRV